MDTWPTIARRKRWARWLNLEKLEVCEFDRVNGSDVGSIWEAAMRTKQIISLIATSFILFGCARSSSMMLDNRTASISTSAAPVCGAEGAQQVAMKNAAIATLKSGYDRYIILDGKADSNVRVVGHTPVYGTSQTNGNVTLNQHGNMVTGTYQGTTTTQVYGGYPIIAGRHKQDLVVTMFRRGDPDFERAVDARSVLGPKWQKLVSRGNMLTCLD